MRALLVMSGLPRYVSTVFKNNSPMADNPLWRTVMLREGQLVRRTCCQRYRLPDVQQCGDCTLK